jgi:hypothetical protein
MRVHTKIVINISTNEVIEDEYFEYDGPLALCDGGGDGGTGGDAGNSDAGNESGGGSPLGGDEGDAGAPGMGGSTGGTGSDSGGGALGGGTGATGLGGADSGIGGALGGDSSAGMGDTGMGSAEGDSTAGDDGTAAGADVGMGVDAAMAEAEAAATSNVDAEMNSMSPETSVSIGLPSVSAVVGAIASALSGNPVAGLAGLVGSMANNSSITSSDPSQATALGNLAAHGMAVPAGFGGESLGGFGGTIGDNYGGDGGGPADTLPIQNAQPNNNPKPPAENPPVVNPGTGTGGPGTNPGEIEDNLIEERRRRNAVGWLDMLHNEGEAPAVYTPTAFEPTDKQKAVEKTTQLPSWLDTDEEKEKFYGGLFTTYGI